jgi:hypothetical protein
MTNLYYTANKGLGAKLSEERLFNDTLSPELDRDDLEDEIEIYQEQRMERYQ